MLSLSFWACRRISEVYWRSLCYTQRPLFGLASSKTSFDFLLKVWSTALRVTERHEPKVWMAVKVLADTNNIQPVFQTDPGIAVHRNKQIQESTAFKLERGLHSKKCALLFSKCALLFFKCKPHLHQVQAAFLKKQGAFFKVLFEIEVLDMLFYKLCMSLSFL